MFDAEDRKIVVTTVVRVGAAVVGVLVAAATFGAAWHIFRMVGGF